MFPRAVAAAAPPRPYTVSELLAEVGEVLRTTWRDVSVVGEIGDWNVNATSGHCYFKLKDKASSVDAVIFASDLRRLKFKPEPGLEVVVRGVLDLYAPRGRFQIKTFTIEPVGVGALQLAFEQLKKKLEAEGLFEPGRKRPLPRLPRRIGIVTSPDGAAIRDVLHVLRRRFDGLALTIYPVRVQGDLAAAEITAAVRALNRRGGFDVLILARGGGSAEDLACFNDERVARAIAGSRIPTISAVGHETDWSIADFVADLRAPTPSAAAEIVVERKGDLERSIAEGRARLLRAARSRIGLERARWRGLSRDGGLLRLPWRLKQWRERVGQGRDALVTTLERRPLEFGSRLTAAHRALRGFSRLAQMPRRRETVERLRSLLVERSGRRLEVRRARLSEAAGRLELLSPLAVLARGYAVAYRDGSAVPLLSASAVAAGESIRVRLHEGELKAVVRERTASAQARTAKAEAKPAAPASSGELPLFGKDR